MKLRVKVLANASKTELAGWEEHPLHGRLLRVRVAAPPVDGAANQALEKFLARHFNLPRSQVTVMKGGSSKIKLLSFPDDVHLPD